MPAPLHGKKAYVFIQSALTETMNVVSFATEFAINYTPQAIARALVLGTDAVPGVDAQGYTARARINLLLSPDEPEWLSVMGNTSESDSQILVDYIKGVVDVQAEKAWPVTEKLNVIIAALKDNLTLAQVESTPAELESAIGYYFHLDDAPLVALEPVGRVGEYINVRFEVETGAWKQVATIG